ncbi:MAG: ABC transporter substrate-binding protein [Gemmatimonadetes bacterium]|nr:MAG: ABC transporter substrate-binding protein [Gemmatimonadota bacterium]
MGTKPTLKIGHLQITDHLILGVTENKLRTHTEEFQYGDIETIPMVGWYDVGSSLMKGDIDIAFMLAPYAMDLFHAGVKAQLILLAHKSGSIIVTNKRANIRKLEDFKGKTVLIPYNLSIHYMLFDQLLKEKGLTTGVGKDVTFEVVAPSQIPQAIKYDEAGEIGGYIVAEPYGTQVVLEGWGEEFALSKDIWPNHPCCVVVARDEVIHRYPNLLHELTESLVKSGDFVHDHVDETTKIGANFLNQKEDVVRTVLTTPPDRVTTRELFPVLEDLDRIQTYLTEKVPANTGMSGKIDLEKFVNITFAAAAGAK